MQLAIDPAALSEDEIDDLMADEWKAALSSKPSSYRDSRSPTQYAAAHAPAGGVSVAGKQFTGGQFIPGDVMAEATPEERAKVEGGEAKKSSAVRLGLLDANGKATDIPSEPLAKEGKEAFESAVSILKQSGIDPEKIGGAMVLFSDPTSQQLAYARGDDVRLNLTEKNKTDLEKTWAETEKSVQEGTVPLYVMSSLTDVLVHELAHNIARRWTPEEHAEWERVFEQNQNVDELPSFYAQENSSEMWAECVTALLTGKPFGGTAQEYKPSTGVVKKATASLLSRHQTPPPVSPTTAKVLSRLPRTAYARLASRVTKFEEAPTVEAVTDAWYAGEPNPPPVGKRTPCYGFYDPADGRLVIGPGSDKVDAVGTLAHEIGHALDQSEDRKHFDLSGDPEFVQAWRAEMGRGQLSNYARTDEVEGFAEFGRLLWGTEGGQERARSQFPRSYAYFKRTGLVE